MISAPLHPARLSLTSAVSSEEFSKTFDPQITNTPDLPAVDWASLGVAAPKTVGAGSGLPTADAVVITWADAELAAMNQVFCGSGPLPYSSKTNGSWPGWVEYSEGAPSDLGYWGSFCHIELGGASVLLFKSNVHFSEADGQQNLQALTDRLIQGVSPQLVLSIGTPGGARLTDHVGTVNIVDADTLYVASAPQNQWQTFTSAWKPTAAFLAQSAFQAALLPIPTIVADIQSIVAGFNQFYSTSFTQDQLDPLQLNFGDKLPAVNDLTANHVPLLTANSFVVANTSGNLSSFACVEMDDAVIAQTCGQAGKAFGSVRNISDPIQNAALPPEMQGHWGEAIYTAYGIYTSYNGALATAMALAGQFGAG